MKTLLRTLLFPLLVCAVHGQQLTHTTVYQGATSGTTTVQPQATATGTLEIRAVGTTTILQSVTVVLSATAFPDPGGG